jgi:hypothetical protein
MSQAAKRNMGEIVLQAEVMTLLTSSSFTLLTGAPSAAEYKLTIDPTFQNMARYANILTPP